VTLEDALRTYGPALSRLASAYARNKAERDDLLQDIALALLVALPTFRNECPERAFVLRVAHNRALALVTRRRVNAALEPLDDDVIDATPAPPEVAEQRARRRALVDAIRKLPLAHRQAVLLSLEGLSHDEIGAVLGLNANAVGVRLHRARADLATSMGVKP
jgi:RNA polymerase sigma factor (sigma-70 family)